MHLKLKRMWINTPQANVAATVQTILAAFSLRHDVRDYGHPCCVSEGPKLWSHLHRSPFSPNKTSWALFGKCAHKQTRPNISIIPTKQKQIIPLQSSRHSGPPTADPAVSPFPDDSASAHSGHCVEFQTGLGFRSFSVLDTFISKMYIFWTAVARMYMQFIKNTNLLVL